ncbi:MAG: hypothetical protein HYS07_01220 [Chlamydiae bacterium]|nr:hypothetical protein [Chlamydiota bacterium]MBI3276541.1 hypothetical protein [Chlamydiota bacterium]
MNSIPTPIQERFKVETRELLVKRIRVYVFIATTLVPLFGFLDLVTTPEHFKFFMILRLVTCSIILLIFASSYLKFFKRFSREAGILIVTIIGLMISIMIRFLGGYESSYYAGLNLVLLVMGLLLPWKMKDTLYAVLIVYAFYLIPILIFDHITNFPLFINNNFFLLSTMLITLVASHVGHQYHWREFLAKTDMEKSNQALESSNQALISAKKDLEDSYLKLQELDRLKTQFFGNISHELRTPLTLILAPVEMMLKDKEGHLEPHQTKNLNVVRNNALRLLKLMNQLLDLIKIDAGKLELRLSQVNVRDFFREIEDSMSALAEQKNLKLSFECEESLQGEFDRDQIEKVIMNLVYNAVKFTPEGGSIEVRAKTVDEEAEEGLKIDSVNLSESS